MMANAVYGLFRNREHADMAVDELYKAGFQRNEISFVAKEDIARMNDEDTTGSNVAEGAASGATTGGIIGGIAGLLIGLGAITLPGIGAILIGGPIAAALGLTGAAATTATGALTGALAGGLVGGLVGLGVPEEEAREYETGVSRGGIMIGVNAREGEEGTIRSIFERHGADRITVTS